MATHSSILAWRIPGTEEPGGLLSIGSHRVGHDWSDLACRRALEKEMVTHSSVLAWRIPGREGPSGLPSMGSHRVRHDWSDLAAAATGERRRGGHQRELGNQVSGAIWLLSVQKGHSQLSVDLSFLIRKQKLWAGCFRRLLLSPTTQGNPGSGARVQSAGLWKQQKPAFQNTESPPRCACRQLITGGLPLLTLPSPGSGIWGHWGVIWLRTLGPSFRGVTRVRLQVTQIATLCVVPRGGCPGDSMQGQRPRLLLWYGWPLIPHDSPGGGRGGSACSSKHLQIL